jgi:hypothetical protein
MTSFCITFNMTSFCITVRVMVFNATFNNISVISWKLDEWNNILNLIPRVVSRRKLKILNPRRSSCTLNLIYTFLLMHTTCFSNNIHHAGTISLCEQEIPVYQYCNCQETYAWGMRTLVLLIDTLFKNCTFQK